MPTHHVVSEVRGQLLCRHGVPLVVVVVWPAPGSGVAPLLPEVQHAAPDVAEVAHALPVAGPVPRPQATLAEVPNALSVPLPLVSPGAEVGQVSQTLLPLAPEQGAVLGLATSATLGGLYTVCSKCCNMMMVIAELTRHFTTQHTIQL